MSGAMDSVDTYSSGMASGYGATPFKMQMWGSAYINTDGYLYGAGFNQGDWMGIGNTNTQSTFTKMGVQTGTTGTGVSTTGFKNPIDYDFGGNTAGIVADSSGKVWTSGSNHDMTLGWGSGYTSSDYNYFRTVATSGTSGATYLPSNYQAVAVSMSDESAGMILTSTGALYGAGYPSHLGGNTNCASGTFYRLDGLNSLPAATSSNPIVDFSAGYESTYILYKDGSLYYGASSTWTKMNPSGVTFKMFDMEASWTRSYLYAVTTDNKIYYAQYNSTSMTYLMTATGTVTQVRGFNGLSNYGWGYLNSAGALYLSSSTSSSSTTSTASTSSYYNSGVTYFDGHGHGNNAFGIIQNGVTKFWGSNGAGSLGNGSTSPVAISSPYTPSNVDTSYDGQGPHDISNTPPANCHFPRK